MALIARLIRLVCSERFTWGVIALVLRLVNRARGRFLGRLLGWSRAFIGPRSYIAGSRFMRVGSEFYCREGAWLEAVFEYGCQSFQPELHIGDGVRFSSNVHVSAISRVVIESGVLVGSNVYISDHGHGSYRGPVQSDPCVPPASRPLGFSGDVMIRENCWIGDGVVIVGPATIGKGSVVGANSVVTGDVPPNAIVVGAPAKVVRIYDEQEHVWRRHE